MHIKLKNKRGQSTVEYVLLVTAVLAVIIAFTASQQKGGFQDQLNTTLNAAVQQMGDESDAFAGSHHLDNSTNSATNSIPDYSVNIDPN